MNIIDRITSAGRVAFGYEAVESRGRRKPPTVITRAEDRELDSSKRRTLIGTARDLTRNFTLAGWAVRKHLDYVSTFDFQARTPDRDLNKYLEAYMYERCKPGRIDHGRRHSLRRLMRLWEASRMLDGDVLLVLLADGRIQTIEGDRIKQPAAVIPEGATLTDFVHGVQIDPVTGQAVRYAIHNRGLQGSETMNFAGFVEARFAHLHAHYTRYDQVRGVSPMAPAINTFRDVYENFDYALAKAKVAQLFAMAITRAQDAGAITGDDDTDEAKSKYDIDFGRGPIKLEMEPGDDAKILESNQPSTQFQAFTDAMISVALKSLDIPVSFYDESKANNSSLRGAWKMYEQAAKIKRADLEEALDRITGFIFAVDYRNGLLELPAGVRPQNINWQWVHRGIPWVDPLKEITADITEVNNAFNTRRAKLAERGLDYFDVIDGLAEEQAYAAQMGVALTAVTAPDLGAVARNEQKEQTDNATQSQN
jgi:capsid protein